jgi:hypothetical protein
MVSNVRQMGRNDQVMLKLVFTRSAEQFYEPIMAIRRSMFYDTPYDERYWNGGVHQLLSVEAIRDAHASDPTSYFALSLTSDEQVGAYARFSLDADVTQLLARQVIGVRDLKVAVLHIIAVHPNFRGQTLVWQMADHRVLGRSGQVMYEEIIKFCATQGCHVLLADVCVLPVPNLRSLVLHKNLGFMTLGGRLGLQTRVRDDKPRIQVSFVRLIRAVRVGWSLKRLPDYRLQLMPPA